MGLRMFLGGIFPFYGTLHKAAPLNAQVADGCCSPRVHLTVPTQNEEGTDTWRPTEEDTITIESVTIANYPGPTAEELAAQSESAAESSAASDSEAVG